jgi:two-component system response regulator MtrA
VEVTVAPKILVVEDDPGVSTMVGIILADAGYDSVVCGTGSGAFEAFVRESPDLVLLDVMLPGMSGIEVCRLIRDSAGTPIIMLTAKDSSEDIVEGLEAGADDYLTKPFDQSVLIARIRARLRPLAQTASSQLTIADLSIDLDAHEVTRAGAAISLTPLEFNLLAALASRPTQVFTRDMLLEEVWGYQYKADTRLVNVHVQRLRSKVEHDPDNPQIVATVRGIGYRAGAL